jgi:hypothetical protein
MDARELPLALDYGLTVIICIPTTNRDFVEGVGQGRDAPLKGSRPCLRCPGWSAIICGVSVP